MGWLGVLIIIVLLFFSTQISAGIGIFLLIFAGILVLVGIFSIADGSIGSGIFFHNFSNCFRIICVNLVLINHYIF